MNETAEQHLDKLRTVAAQALHVWGTAYNEAVTWHEFECPELDEAMNQLCIALLDISKQFPKARAGVTL